MTQLRLRSDAIWREANGEVLALDPAMSKYVSANASGGLLWKMLADGATRDQLVQALVDQFGIERDVAARDTDAFIAELDQNGFLDTAG